MLRQPDLAANNVVVARMRRNKISARVNWFHIMRAFTPPPYLGVLLLGRRSDTVINFNGETRWIESHSNRFTILRIFCRLDSIQTISLRTRLHLQTVRCWLQQRSQEYPGLPSTLRHRLHWSFLLQLQNLIIRRKNLTFRQRIEVLTDTGKTWRLSCKVVLLRSGAVTQNSMTILNCAWRKQGRLVLDALDFGL